MELADLKQKYATKRNLTSSDFPLYADSEFRGKPLARDETLGECGIVGSTKLYIPPASDQDWSRQQRQGMSPQGQGFTLASHSHSLPSFQPTRHQRSGSSPPKPDAPPVSNRGGGPKPRRASTSSRGKPVDMFYDPKFDPPESPNRPPRTRPRMGEIYYGVSPAADNSWETAYRSDSSPSPARAGVMPSYPDEPRRPLAGAPSMSPRGRPQQTPRPDGFGSPGSEQPRRAVTRKPVGRPGSLPPLPRGRGKSRARSPPRWNPYADTGDVFHYLPTPLLSQEDTVSRLRAWDEKARRGRFDADVHIVDPDAHLSHLDYVERSVVWRSEFFRRRGFYDLRDPPRRPGPSRPAPTRPASDDVSPLTSDDEGAAEAPRWREEAAESLKESQRIVEAVAASLEDLESWAFSRGSFSLLVQSSGHVAELRAFTVNTIVELRNVLAKAVAALNGPEGSKEDVYGVAQRCSNILDLARLSIIVERDVDSLRDDVQLAVAAIRRTAVLLDLVLVSYVGSHGTAFHHYAELETDRISIPGYGGRLRGITCSRRPLACLAGYLDDVNVWVFELEGSRPQSTGRQPYSTRQAERSRGLCIVTKMEHFADVWGPVWPVEPSGGRAGEVFQYNLTRGCVAPVGPSFNGGPVECHWFPTPDHAREAAAGDPRGPVTVSKHQLVRIGARLEANDRCAYTADHYEQDHAADLAQLGSLPEEWRGGFRPPGFRAGEYVGLTATGVPKRLPAATLREHIWTRLNFSPETANIEFLDNDLGVELSACTGNARRVPLRRLLMLRGVLDRLDRALARWRATEWGGDLADALAAPSFAGLGWLWSGSPELRAPVAALLCRALELLHYTGEAHGRLLAAYFHRLQPDRQAEPAAPGSEWAAWLGGSRRSAAYAAVSDVCLRLDGGGGGCNSRERAPTVLATRLVFPGEEDPEEGDLVQAEGHPEELFEVLERGRTDRLVLRAVNRQRGAPALGRGEAKPAREVLDAPGRGGKQDAFVFRAVVEADERTWAGMTRPKQPVSTQSGRRWERAPDTEDDGLHLQPTLPIEGIRRRQKTNRELEERQRGERRPPARRLERKPPSGGCCVVL